MTRKDEFGCALDRQREHQDSALHEMVRTDVWEIILAVQGLGLSDVWLVIVLMICEWYQSNGVGRVPLSSKDCPRGWKSSED